jgi:hypothetical protein
MLEVIAYFVPLVLIALVGAYVYIETQKRKAIEVKKKAVIVYVATIKDKFKTKIIQLVEQEILTIKQHQSIYRIANNFFIFQPVTSKSIEFCEHTLNNVISAIPNGGADTPHFVLLQEKISLFVMALPVVANGYNASFYRNELPLLIKGLVESKENIFRIESELSNEELRSPVTPAVTPEAA